MTLSECLDMGRLSMAEALRLSMHLADALRRLHDQGRVHGALTPDRIELGEGGLRLVAAPEESAGAITAYTAPEVIQGQAADARSDIFSFGAIVYEMASGQRAFDGERETPPALGSPALDNIVGACVAKDPRARVPRIQRVMLELKLVAVAAKRAEVSANLRREKAKGATRDQLEELESRIEARLVARAEAQDRAIEELRQTVREAMESSTEQISRLCSALTATQEQLAAATAVPVEQQVTEVTMNLMSEVNGAIRMLAENTEALKHTVEEMTRRSQQFEQRVSNELMDLSRTTKSNAQAIEASQKSAAQNEDLMERVIEALESLHSDVLDTDGPAAEEAVLAL